LLDDGLGISFGCTGAAGFDPPPAGKPGLAIGPQVTEGGITGFGAGGGALPGGT
jgi:hypothetical protein